MSDDKKIMKTLNGYTVYDEEAHRRIDSLAGSAPGLVFDTVADMEAYVAEHHAELKVGQNLYIREVDVPDYWWDGTAVQELETKVDLSGCAKQEEVDQLSEAIADKLDADKLPEAIDTALEQAKESGEFDGAPGTPGQPGANGTTPHIGANGNWYIGDTDTGVQAQGEPGEPGQPGAPGDDYVLTAQDKTEIAEIAAGLVDVPEGGGAKEWKLLRNITIPEDPSTDTSGVAYSERANGGYYFSFDTDEDGNPFLVKELLMRTNASTTNASAYTGITTPCCIHTRMPPDYSTVNIPVCVPLGKTGSKNYGWCYLQLTPMGWIDWGGYNGGSGKGNMATERDFKAVLTDGLATIGFMLNNLIEVGFEAGSTFKIYGR